MHVFAEHLGERATREECIQMAECVSALLLCDAPSFSSPGRTPAYSRFANAPSPPPLHRYYEAKNEWEPAGSIYARPQCGNFRKALMLFLRCGDRALTQAIAVVGSARQDSLTHMLIDFLNGETDNLVKDAKYIYQLCVWAFAARFRRDVRCARACTC